MADGVEAVLTPEQQIQLRDDRIDQMQIEYQQLLGAFQQLNQNPLPQQAPIQPPPPPPPPPPLPLPRPNLNLPQPPFYSGSPLELNTFKIKLSQYLLGNFNTFFDDASKLLYAGGLLSGPAHQWYETILDPLTLALPNRYTLEIFLAELTAFFGGGVTMASREHSLDNLRQTGSVSDLAIAFQNIVNTYNPRWTDSACIYIFSRKLKEAVRFELAARGNVPHLFQDYIADAIAVEHNLAAAVKGRPYHQQQQHS